MVYGSLHGILEFALSAGWYKGINSFCTNNNETRHLSVVIELALVMAGDCWEKY